MSRASGLGYWQRPEGLRPWVLGHRGVRGRGVKVAENTLGAFDAAIAAGADGIELDVRLAKDGAVVVVHDDTLTRVTRGAHTARVDALTSAELRTVTLPGAQHVPTLDEVLVWSERHQCRMNVELKYDGRATELAAAAAQVVTAHGSPARLLFSSFDLATVVELAERLEGALVGWLSDAPVTISAVDGVLAERNIVAIHPKHSLLNATTLAALRRRFAIVNTWTVNDSQRAVELARLGVDAIITDDPAGTLAALKEA